ncbi:MAG: DNA gyrase subunit A, partial [Bacteroidales bacterium]|nr:DNA gyrase subunit A [Bacteroidales bacterium]
INQSGITLRMSVKDIRVAGRATQGVKLIDLKKRGDTIASVCKVASDEEEKIDETMKEDSAESQELHEEHKVEAAERRVNREAEEILDEMNENEDPDIAEDEADV